MRPSIVCLGAALALAGCGPVRTNGVHELAPPTDRYVRIYEHSIPECPYREVGSVRALSYREMQAAAYRMHANAVILEPEGEHRGGTRTGTAVAFTRPDCQR